MLVLNKHIYWYYVIYLSGGSNGTTGNRPTHG